MWGKAGYKGLFRNEAETPPSNGIANRKQLNNANDLEIIDTASGARLYDFLVSCYGIIV